MLIRSSSASSTCVDTERGLQSGADSVMRPFGFFAALRVCGGRAGGWMKAKRRRQLVVVARCGPRPRSPARLPPRARSTRAVRRRRARANRRRRRAGRSRARERTPCRRRGPGSAASASGGRSGRDGAARAGARDRRAPPRTPRRRSSSASERPGGTSRAMSALSRAAGTTACTTGTRARSVQRHHRDDRLVLHPLDRTRRQALLVDVAHADRPHRPARADRRRGRHDRGTRRRSVVPSDVPRYDRRPACSVSSWRSSTSNPPAARSVTQRDGARVGGAVNRTPRARRCRPRCRAPP